MLERKFSDVMSELSQDIGNRKIAVAFSGGADSTALLLLLRKHFEDFQIFAITVNHNLRKESRDEAMKAKKIAESFGVEHVVLEWRHSGVGSNVQEKARLARYNLLLDFCNRHNINKLFVAHHKNDVAETFVMNLFRGSGIYGLSAIPPVSLRRGVKLIRPLLSVEKKSLKEFLKRQKISWIEDPSNSKDVFLRTKIRNLFDSKAINDIISKDLLINRLVLASNNLTRAKHVIEKNVSDFLRERVVLCEQGYVELDLQLFTSLAEEVALRVLSICLSAVVCNKNHSPRMVGLQALYSSIINGRSRATLHGCETHVRKNVLYIYREAGKNKLLAKSVGDHAWIWDDRFEICSFGDNVSEIVNCSFEDVDKKKNKSKQNFPRKIWKTLPLIITYEGSRVVPFLNSGYSRFFSIKFLGELRVGSGGEDL